MQHHFYGQEHEHHRPQAFDQLDGIILAEETAFPGRAAGGALPQAAEKIFERRALP